VALYFVRSGMGWAPGMRAGLVEGEVWALAGNEGGGRENVRRQMDVLSRLKNWFYGTMCES